MDNSTNIVSISATCFDYVRVFSDGIRNEKPGESILRHSLIRFYLQVLVMISLASGLNHFLKRFYMPRFTSDILAGIILGPTVLGNYLGNVSEILFPTAEPNQVLAGLSKIGYILFTFLVAVRMDLKLIRKTGKTALIIGHFLFIFPYTMVHTAEINFNKNVPVTEATRGGRANFALIYFSEITTTQLVGVTYILMQLKITNSRLGHLALASTLISELGRSVYATVIGYRNALSQTSLHVGIQSVVFSLALLAIIVVPLRKIVFMLIKRTPEGKPVKEIYTSIVMATVFYLSSIGDTAGMNYLYGPFIFGLVVPSGSPLAENLIAKFDAVVTEFFMPLMVIFCATKFDLWQFFAEVNDTVNFQAALVGFSIKLVANFIVLICCKLPLRDAAALTIILNAKGVKEIGIFLSYGNLEIMETESTSGIFLVFLLSLIQTPLVKKLYDPAKQYIGHWNKCIQYASNDTELSILVCAYRQDDAMAALKLLQYSNPTKQSHLSIYGVCLEEQLSRDTPLLINHQLGQKSSSSRGSHLQPIIDTFKYFNLQSKKYTQLNVFTAVSQLQQMHEDVCWLAFDKSCSLIILPFHKKWNRKSSMVSGRPEVRNLNINALDRAPCSVGILIDRRRNNDLSSIFVTSTTYRVATFFVGGPDDREALAYALRMAKNPQVQLTVMQLKTSHGRQQDQWEAMLDGESLTSLRQEISKSTNINYKEQEVTDGSDAAEAVQSIQENCDLVMVGRRHETEPAALSGLSEWIELPELGPLGDLLASSDISQAVSVLVVQQQIMKASHSSILN